MKENLFKLSLEACERVIDGETIRGQACTSDGETLYHHTDFKNMDAILKTGALVPSPDPYQDGTVNFTLNEGFHRFGSIRLLFERAAVATEPACYVDGEDQRKLNSIVDQKQEEARQAGQWKSTNRVEGELGVEPSTYQHECKQLTRTPVDLKNLKGLEYWMPWHLNMLGAAAVGTAVSPRNASYDVWTNGRPALPLIREQIERARQIATDKGIPFQVRSCYPYASLDRSRVLPLDEENLRHLEQDPYERDDPQDFASAYRDGEKGLRVISLYDKEVEALKGTPSSCPQEQLGRIP